MVGLAVYELCLNEAPVFAGVTQKSVGLFADLPRCFLPEGPGPVFCVSFNCGPVLMKEMQRDTGKDRNRQHD